jgi:CheY-like chemotaxis protein
MAVVRRILAHDLGSMTKRGASRPPPGISLSPCYTLPVPLLPSLPPEGHRILVIEDDLECQRIALEWLAARGDRPRGVGSVDEAFQAMREEEFCLFVVDQEIPQAKDGTPLTAGGRRVLEAIRKADPRRVDLAHLTPVVVWSGYSAEPDFIWSMKDHGADGFLTKSAGPEKFQAEIAKRLHLSGRSDHSACASFAVELPGVAGRPESKKFPGEAAPPVEIDVIGEKDGPRTLVLVNDERRPMQDGKFLLLLRLIDQWERPGHPWADRAALGIEESREAISRVRAVFRGLAPPGFDVIQSDRSGRFRLHPEVLVVMVPWKELVEHPHPGVRRLAAQHNAWRAEENRRPGAREELPPRPRS